MAFKNREEMLKHWNDYAREHLVGRTIRAASYMSSQEQDSQDWNASALVIELDNGTIIYPMADDEGNAPGALIGSTKGHDPLLFPVV